MTRFELADHLERDHTASAAVVDALQPPHIRYGLLRARRAQREALEAQDRARRQAAS